MERLILFCVIAFLLLFGITLSIENKRLIVVDDETINNRTIVGDSVVLKVHVKDYNLN